MSIFYMRNPAAVAIARGEAFYFLRQNQGPLQISPTDVETLADRLQALVMPVSAEALKELLDEETSALFIKGGILISGTEEELLSLLPATRKPQRPCKHLVFAVTGAVAEDCFCRTRCGIVSMLFADFSALILSARSDAVGPSSSSEP